MLGQRWVIDVVANRVKSPHWPNTVCGVVRQHRQFTWYNSAKSVMPDDPIKWHSYIVGKYGSNTIEMRAWALALKASTVHLLAPQQDWTLGATNYVTVSTYRAMEGTEHWCRTLPVQGTIQDHIFFRDNTLKGAENVVRM